MIYQFVPAISKGDAVSNDIFALSAALTKTGKPNRIAAKSIPAFFQERVDSFSAFAEKITSEDLLIYHMAVGCEMNKWIMSQTCRKVMIYHNITPENYFTYYDINSAAVTRQGRHDLALMAPHFDLAIGDSEYNAQELRDLGYKNVHSLPLLIPFADYEATPDRALLEKYDDDYLNLLFVGRMVPNKCIEDIISAFSLLKKLRPRSRLFLVGSQSMERYAHKLINYVTNLELEDVIFAGFTTFPEILAYYKLADLFLCMSEHEGFCVPVVEAMLFDIPVLAYASSAVPETLGVAGVVFSEKNFPYISGLINKIASDESIRTSILAAQRERLKAFAPGPIADRFIKLIESI